MNELDVRYARLLHLGFIILKEAAHSDDREWLDAEVEMLHNVPSLLGEENIERHRYFWFSERQAYIDWTSKSGRDQARSRMLTFYSPIWQEMEPLIAEMLQLHGTARR
ncbi:MAG: hypothetical protein WD875_11050 [Pirellulales bacterium]